MSFSVDDTQEENSSQQDLSQKITQTKNFYSLYLHRTKLNTFIQFVTLYTVHVEYLKGGSPGNVSEEPVT